jgi:hypothetical protein
MCWCRPGGIVGPVAEQVPKNVRNLQMYLNSLAEHLLDWFYVAMRLTVMGQMNK